MAKAQKPKKVASGGQPTAAQRRLAAQQAVARASATRASARRRRRLAVYLPVTLVLVIVLVMVLINAANSNDKAANTASNADAVAAKIAAVPPAVFDTVGVGTSSSPPTALTGAPLTENGLPRTLYVGAEWCPFCAAERWPLTTALSRFGTFTGLGQTASSPNDVHPNTPTLTYANATYTSKYLVFSPKELEDGNRNVIDTLSASDAELFTTLGGNSFPFIDLGGKYSQTAAQFNPDVLAGQTQDQIATALSDPNSSDSKAIVGAANVLTAAICKTTGGQPANVCTSTGVTTGATALGSQ